MAVRRESVVLDVESNLASVMARDAAAAALLKRELSGLGRASNTSTRAMGDAEKAFTKTGTAAERSGRQIDKYSGRLRLLTDAAVSLGPALIPLGAVGVPAVMALATGFGAAAGAAGVALLAFNGVGDALKAMDAYQIEPTTENLLKMQTELGKLGPAGAEFAKFLDDLEPQLHALQDTARAGLFPGVEAGIRELMPLLPQVQRIIGEIATGMGRLTEEAGDALSGPGFAAFFDYLESDAAPVMMNFAHATGNVAEGLGSLVVAFGPLTGQFSHGLESMTQTFADWAASLSQTDGFRGFVDYIRESGPMVADLLGAIGNAFVAIVRAAAPMGQVVVPVLTALANALSAIASSPIGPSLFTAAAGFIALNRAVSILGPSVKSLNTAFLDLRTSPDKAATAVQRFGGAARIAAGASGMGLFVASLHETNQGLSTLEGAAGGALAGFAVGGPWGAAVGGAIGLVASLGKAHDETAAEVDNLAASFDRQTGAITENTRAQVVSALQQAGALEAAQRLGIGLDTLTAAAMGNADAQHQIALGYTENFTALTGLDDKSRESAQRQEKDWRVVTTAVNGQSAAVGKAADQAKLYSEALNGSAGATKRASERLQAARLAAARTATSFITLGDSLNDSKVSLNDWIRQLQKQADALRHFADNAVKAAHRGLDNGLIKSLQEAGPEGALRMKQLADATDSQIARANQSWRSGQRAIRDYVNTVGGVPTAHATTLSVRDLATMKVRAIKSQLATIDRNIDIYFRAHATRLPSVSGMGPQITSADGSTVPGPRYPYGDKIIAAVAPGEEIISNRYGQADRWRPLLKAINDNHFAVGGTVGGLVGSRPFGMDDAAVAARDLARALNDSARNARDEAATRKRLLQHEIDRDQKEVDAAKQRLDALKQERQAIVDSVKAAYRTDIFGAGSGLDLSASGMSAQAQAAFQQNMRENALEANISRQRQALRILRELRRRGLDGPAFTDLAAQGDIETLRGYESLPDRGLRQYERQYREQIRLGNRLGQYAGDAEMGADIRAQRRSAERSEAHLKSLEAQMKQLNRRTAHLEKLAEKNPKETGAHVASGVNSGAAAGQKRRGR